MIYSLEMLNLQRNSILIISYAFAASKRRCLLADSGSLPSQLHPSRQGNVTTELSKALEDLQRIAKFYEIYDLSEPPFHSTLYIKMSWQPCKI
jgi:hypothetical protein